MVQTVILELKGGLLKLWFPLNTVKGKSLTQFKENEAPTSQLSNFRQFPAREGCHYHNTTGILQHSSGR